MAVLQVLTLRSNLVATLPGASEAEAGRALECYAPLGPDPYMPRLSPGFDAAACGSWLVSPCTGVGAHGIPVPANWPGTSAEL